MCVCVEIQLKQNYSKFQKYELHKFTTASFGKVYKDDIKERDDDFSSKQGSLCTFKIILITIKYFYVYICIYFYLL